MIPTDLSTIREQIYQGQLSLEILVRNYLQRIQETEHLNIYIEVFQEDAVEHAKILDQKFKENPESVGSLFGAVLSIKDVICYEGHEVTAGSAILKGFFSQFTATALEKALEEDAIIIGRTNCDEFAMGSTNESSIYGPTLNGLDESRIPGGSSGGAAVSIQQNTCLAAIGSDTGGSVRQPAALCGVYGLKPTYGRISRNGLIAYASSFDQIGLLSHNIQNLATILSVLSGKDPLDSSSSNMPSTSPKIHINNRKYKIALIAQIDDKEGISASMQSHLNLATDKLHEDGHVVGQVDFELIDYLVPAYYVLTTAEASSNLSRYDGIRYGLQPETADNIDNYLVKTRSEGFGLEVKRRIMMGTFVLSIGYYEAYFEKAQKVRKRINEDIHKILENYDFIMLPTVLDVAWKLGYTAKDPVKMYLSDVFTVLANLTGLPSISIPVNCQKSQLPLGIQLISKKFNEDQLLSFSSFFDSMAR